MTARICSKVSCNEPASATLTFDYTGQVTVLGPLSPKPEPGCYDLCAAHERSFVAPQGWELIRYRSLPKPANGEAS